MLISALIPEMDISDGGRLPHTMKFTGMTWISRNCGIIWNIQDILDVPHQFLGFESLISIATM